MLDVDYRCDVVYEYIGAGGNGYEIIFSAADRN